MWTMRRREPTAGFPVATQRSMIMVALAITHDEPMKAATQARSATPAFASDAARWDAVQRRDRSAGGAFWYSVRTTGAYCRPSCASRQPRRENVAFHASPAAAEKAGF